MIGEAARYDAIADWYIEFSKDWDSEPFALLPADLGGRRILDLACGHCVASRYLARRRALVTGLDISAGLPRRARALEDDAGGSASRCSTRATPAVPTDPCPGCRACHQTVAMPVRADGAPEAPECAVGLE